MARQSGPFFITGTYNDICFYKLDGVYYARRKSSLSGKRVKRDKAFALTMRYAGIMGQASTLAAEVYRRLPKGQKQHALYRHLVGKANGFLKDGLDAEEVKMRLEAVCREVYSKTRLTADAIAVVDLNGASCTSVAGQNVGTVKDETKVRNTSFKTIRITKRQRPLIRGRNGRLCVSAQGLISSMDDSGRIIMMPPPVTPIARPAACGGS